MLKLPAYQVLLEPIFSWVKESHASHFLLMRTVGTTRAIALELIQCTELTVHNVYLVIIYPAV